MKNVVLNLLKSVGLKLGGLGSWLLGFFLDYAYNRIVDYAKLKKVEYDLKKLDKGLLEEYRLAVADAGLSRKERIDMALRLLNRTP
jgi:hypothetical protein